jgi:hypothetical protein
MTEEEYIGPILSDINSIAVERHRRGEETAGGKTDVRSLFEEEIAKAREVFETFVAKPQHTVV